MTNALDPGGSALDRPIGYRLSRWDLARLAWVHPTWSTWMVVLALIMRVWVNLMRFASKPLMALLGSVSVALGLEADSLPLIIVGIVLLLLLPIGLVKLLVLGVLRRHYAPRGIGALCEVQVTPEALVWRSDHQERQIPWRMVRTAYNLPHSLLLHAPHFGDVLLPKRIFGDADALRAFLALVAARSGRMVLPYRNPLRRPGEARWGWGMWLLLAFVAAALIGVAALTARNG